MRQPVMANAFEKEQTRTIRPLTDGMDAVGLQNIGLMDPEIRALWKDTQKFTHRFIGIAVTARYVPTQKPPAGKMKVEDYDRGPAIGTACSLRSRSFHSFAKDPRW